MDNERDRDRDEEAFLAFDGLAFAEGCFLFFEWVCFDGRCLADGFISSSSSSKRKISESSSDWLLSSDFSSWSSVMRFALVVSR